MKRYRTPKAKPGELKVQWGKLPHNNPDLCYCWGEGVSRADSSLLHYTFSSKRPVLSKCYEAMLSGESSQISFDPSFLEELEARGYDLTTLRFSIQKKTDQTAKETIA